MTREEIIKGLGEISVCQTWEDEVIDEAIKALEQEPCDDKRLFIKIYADYEPSVVAEKVYQICDEDEFPEVVSQLNAYLEHCDDAVSREAVLNAICDYVVFEEYEDKSHTFTIRPLEKRIDALPSVTQKSGKWIEHEIEDTCRWLTCSNCGYEWINRKENFCPNCGVKMESEVRNDSKTVDAETKVSTRRL